MGKLDADQRAEQRRTNQLQKEMEKYEKAKKKQEEREAKAANKAFKSSNWDAWRQEQREEKRLLAEEQKSLFAFYASLEETYETICPDMYLIENTHFNTDHVIEQ